jgi:ABC-type glycerol-3-phosphate transport system substrate-binding protein
MFVWQHGGSVYTPDGTRCVINSPQAAAGLQEFRDLSWKYHVMPTPAEESAMAAQGGWGSGTINQFGGGKAAMAIGARWWLVQLRKDNLRLGACQLPYSIHRVYYGGARATVINAKSAHRQAALDFLRFESSPAYNKLINTEADGICAVIADSAGDDYIHDPKYPTEDFNKAFREAMRYGRAGETSPFINPQDADKILQKQIDLISANEKSIPDGLKDAQDQINAGILAAIAEDPSLKKRYLQVVGGRP